MAEDKPQSTAEQIRDSIGDISDITIMHNQILIGIWIKPQKTAGGILLTDKYRDEDKWQGKVGLVLKKGALAFKDDDRTEFHGQSVKEGDWVIYRVSDGFSIDLNGTHCRLIEDVHIRGIIPNPSIVY